MLPRGILRFSGLALMLALGSAAAAGAQQRRGYELGAQGLLLAQDPLWGGAALYGAWRSGGARFSLALGLGSADAEVSGRGELLAHFLLSPGRMDGVGPYAFGGAAGVTGSRHQGYLVAGLGVEARPGGSSGWFFEAGVGGGARLAGGWRFRRLARAR